MYPTGPVPFSTFQAIKSLENLEKIAQNGEGHYVVEIKNGSPEFKKVNFLINLFWKINNFFVKNPKVITRKEVKELVFTYLLLKVENPEFLNKEIIHKAAKNAGLLPKKPLDETGGKTESFAHLIQKYFKKLNKKQLSKGYSRLLKRFEEKHSKDFLKIREFFQLHIPQIIENDNGKKSTRNEENREGGTSSGNKKELFESNDFDQGDKNEKKVDPSLPGIEQIPEKPLDNSTFEPKKIEASSIVFKNGAPEPDLINASPQKKSAWKTSTFVLVSGAIAAGLAALYHFLPKGDPKNTHLVTSDNQGHFTDFSLDNICGTELSLCDTWPNDRFSVYQIRAREIPHSRKNSSLDENASTTEPVETSSPQDPGKVPAPRNPQLEIGEGKGILQKLSENLGTLVPTALLTSFVTFSLWGKQKTNELAPGLPPSDSQSKEKKFNDADQKNAIVALVCDEIALLEQTLLNLPEKQEFRVQNNAEEERKHELPFFNKASDLFSSIYELISRLPLREDTTLENNQIIEKVEREAYKLRELSEFTYESLLEKGENWAEDLEIIKNLTKNIKQLKVRFEEELKIPLSANEKTLNSIFLSLRFPLAFSRFKDLINRKSMVPFLENQIDLLLERSNLLKDMPTNYLQDVKIVEEKSKALIEILKSDDEDVASILRKMEEYQDLAISLKNLNMKIEEIKNHPQPINLICKWEHVVNPAIMTEVFSEVAVLEQTLLNLPEKQEFRIESEVEVRRSASPFFRRISSLFNSIHELTARLRYFEVNDKNQKIIEMVEKEAVILKYLSEISYESLLEKTEESNDWHGISEIIQNLTENIKQLKTRFSYDLEGPDELQLLNHLFINFKLMFSYTRFYQDKGRQTLALLLENQSELLVKRSTLLKHASPPPNYFQEMDTIQKNAPKLVALLRSMDKETILDEINSFQDLAISLQNINALEAELIQKKIPSKSYYKIRKLNRQVWRDIKNIQYVANLNLKDPLYNRFAIKELLSHPIYYINQKYDAEKLYDLCNQYLDLEDNGEGQNISKDLKELIETIPQEIRDILNSQIRTLIDENGRNQRSYPKAIKNLIKDEENEYTIRYLEFFKSFSPFLQKLGFNFDPSLIKNLFDEYRNGDNSVSFGSILDSNTLSNSFYESLVTLKEVYSLVTGNRIEADLHLSYADIKQDKIDNEIKIAQFLEKSKINGIGFNEIQKKTPEEQYALLMQILPQQFLAQLESCKDDDLLFPIKCKLQVGLDEHAKQVISSAVKKFAMPIREIKSHPNLTALIYLWKCIIDPAIQKGEILLESENDLRSVDGSILNSCLKKLDFPVFDLKTEEGAQQLSWMLLHHAEIVDGLLKVTQPDSSNPLSIPAKRAALVKLSSFFKNLSELVKQGPNQTLDAFILEKEDDTKLGLDALKLASWSVIYDKLDEEYQSAPKDTWTISENDFIINFQNKLKTISEEVDRDLKLLWPFFTEENQSYISRLLAIKTFLANLAAYPQSDFKITEVLKSWNAESFEETDIFKNLIDENAQKFQKAIQEGSLPVNPESRKNYEALKAVYSGLKNAPNERLDRAEDIMRMIVMCGEQVLKQNQI